MSLPPIAQTAAEPLRGWEAVSAGEGISVSITGMLIVFAALSIIALFVAKLPALLAALDPWLPEIEAHDPPTPAEQLPLDEERIVAAIGYALHSRGGG